MTHKHRALTAYNLNDDDQLMNWARTVENTGKWYPAHVWRDIAKKAAGRLVDVLERRREEREACKDA